MIQKMICMHGMITMKFLVSIKILKDVFSKKKKTCCKQRNYYHIIEKCPIFCALVSGQYIYAHIAHLFSIWTCNFVIICNRGCGMIFNMWILATNWAFLLTLSNRNFVHPPKLVYKLIWWRWFRIWRLFFGSTSSFCSNRPENVKNAVFGTFWPPPTPHMVCTNFFLFFPKHSPICVFEHRL